MIILNSIAMLVSLSSSTYISHESDHQVTISVTSSTTSSTDFVIELHAKPFSVTGNQLSVYSCHIGISIFL